MRSRTELAVVLTMIAAPAWGQTGYPSPSSFPARPTYRTPDDTPSRRTRPAPQPTPAADDPELAGQMDDGSPVDAPQASPGASYATPTRAALAAPNDGPPPEVARSTGPTATSGSVSFDQVGRIGGWAGQDVGQAVFLAHPTLPVGSFVEITALDSGRTISAVVMATGGGAVGDLSPNGLTQLGIQAGDGVRVRAATPPPPDQTALRSGHPATLRISAPTSLLTALRQRLTAPGTGPAPRIATVPSRSAAHPAAPHAPAGGAPGANYAAPPRGASQPRPAPARPVAPPTRNATTPRPASAPAVQPQRAAPAVRGGWFVQVAALSNAQRAHALVGQVGGGRVVQSGAIYRVQAGPYANAAAAARARDGIVRRGYAGARVVSGD